MNKIFWCVLFIALLTGCAGPKYTGSAIEDFDSGEIVIINDKETRSGFQETMENWLKHHNYEYVVAPDSSKHDLNKLSLEYVGHWSWDLALYLSEARITAHHKGQRVGEVEYMAPNTLNTNKFGNAEERIGYMMDVIFAESTVDEANKEIKTSNAENTH